MKIPFFYMDLGNIQIFQPQNTDRSIDTRDEDTYDEDEDLAVISAGCPEISAGTLYLNGRDREEDRNILINVNNDRTNNMEELIELLKTIEVE